MAPIERRTLLLLPGIAIGIPLKKLLELGKKLGEPNPWVGLAVNEHGSSLEFED